MILIGIDPGAVHCGYVKLNLPTWIKRDLICEHEPVSAVEVDPYSLCCLLDQFGKNDLGEIWVAIESFHLYGGSKFKIGSSFPEVETIGAIKYLCRKHRFLFSEVGAATHKEYKYGMSKRIKNEHARMAYSVAMYSYRFGKPKFLGI